MRERERKEVRERLPKDERAGPPIILPKLSVPKFDLDPVGELAALWAASVVTTLAGAVMLIVWLPVGIGLMACGALGFFAYLLGCKWAPAPTEG